MLSILALDTSLTQTMAFREKAFAQRNYTPSRSVESRRVGTYYLTQVDDKWRRFYEVRRWKKSVRGEMAHGDRGCKAGRAP
jgi:hypothetical protein